MNDTPDKAENINVCFGRKMTELIKSKKLKASMNNEKTFTDKQLSEMTGIPTSTLKNIKVGKGDISIGNASRISTALSCPIDQFLGEFYDPPGLEELNYDMLGKEIENCMTVFLGKSEVSKTGRRKMLTDIFNRVMKEDEKKERREKRKKNMS